MNIKLEKQLLLTTSKSYSDLKKLFDKKSSVFIGSHLSSTSVVSQDIKKYLEDASLDAKAY